jgi:hypothetical protein
MLGASLVTPAAAAPLRNPPCHTIAVLPTFATDRIMFCGSGPLPSAKHAGPNAIYRSDDAGRTWTGPFTLPTNGDLDHIQGIQPSPNYRRDQTVFVGTYTGGYVTTDGGKTFTQLSSIGNFDNFEGTVFIDGLPGEVATRPALVASGGFFPCCNTVYDPLTTPVTRPVTTPPDWSVVRHYFVPPDFVTSRQAVAIGRSNTDRSQTTTHGTVFSGHSKAYACDGDFVCSRVLYDFAPRGGDTDTLVKWAGTTYPGSPDAHVLTYSTQERPLLRYFRSRDHGRTWAPWTSVERLLDGLPWDTKVYVSASPNNPKRLLLHLSGWGFTSDAKPQEQLFRSDDDGRTWKRIGYAWGPEQKSRGKSTLPWTRSIGAYEPMIVGPGGRVYHVAVKDTGKRPVDYAGLYCSRDFAKTWTRGC